jgi:uncharacterized membrane protein YcaP (DUF421 family)
VAGFLWDTDWGKMLTPQMSLPEILIRGTLVYLALCLLLRVVLKRQAGKVSMTDLVVVSVVAGVCRNPLVRDAYSVTDGVLVVATVLAWSFALDWLSYCVPPVHRLLHAPPVPLIRDGRVLHDHLRHELMTESQLCCKLRGHGVREPADVAEAWMEGDGQVTVIKQPGAGGETPRGRPATADQRDVGQPESAPSGDGRSLADAARELAREVTRHARKLRQSRRRVRGLLCRLDRPAGASAPLETPVNRQGGMCSRAPAAGPSGKNT